MFLTSETDASPGPVWSSAILLSTFYYQDLLKWENEHSCWNDVTVYHLQRRCWYQTRLNVPLWRSNYLCFFGFLLAGTNQGLGYRGFVKRPSRRSLRFLKTCFKNIKFPDNDRLIMSALWNKPGTERDIWDQMRLEFWSRVKPLTLTLASDDIGYLQIFWESGSVESLSMSDVKLLLLVLGPDWAGGWASLLQGERSRLLLSGAGPL